MASPLQSGASQVFIGDASAVDIPATPPDPSGTITGPTAEAVEGSEATFNVTFENIASAWAVLHDGTAEDGARVEVTSSPNTAGLTPTASAIPYTAQLWTASSGGTMLDETDTFVPLASEPGAGALLGTWAVVKTNDDTIAAGAIPDSLGLGFKQGDMPAGEWPQLLVDETPIPYTAWGVSRWPDGSMRKIGLVCRLPNEITGPAGTEVEVEVWSGGSAPSTTTAVALSDAPDINIQLTGVTNLTGTWTSSLAQGRTDDDAVRVFGTGPVGIYAAIGQEFRDGSSNHDHLFADHYVMVLQDASGDVYGVRHIGWAMQAWMDVSTPAVRTFTAKKRNATTDIRDLEPIVSSNGTTTGTDLVLAHYSGFFDAGTSGKMDFIAGTRGAEAPLRWRHDMTYWRKSRLIPPYDLSVAGSINDAGSAQSYRPFCNASMAYAMGTSGERTEIGVFPGWCARHIFKNSANTEQTARVAGLVPAHWRTTIRRSTTKKPPVCNYGPDRAGGTYTGLGATTRTLRYRGTNISGVTTPPSPNTSFWTSETETSHRPSPSYWPHLFTGEWQFLDLLTNYAAQYILSFPGGAPTSFNTSPFVHVFTGENRAFTIGGTDYYGVVVFNRDGNLMRTSAWGTRDVVQAYSALPDTDPSGTDIKGYFEDCVEDSFDCVNALNAAQGAGYQDAGLHMFRGTSDIEGGFAIGYKTGSIAHCYAITGMSRCLTFLDHLTNWWRHLASRSTPFAQAYNIEVRSRDEVANSSRIVEDPSLILARIGVTLTINTSTDTITASNTIWVPTNGDRISPSRYDLATDLPNFRIGYVVNVSGMTFQVALTEGGSPIDLDIGTTRTFILMDCANIGSGFSFENNNSAQSYVASVTGAIRWSAAAGASDMSATLTKAGACLTAANVDFSTEPKNLMQASFE